MAKRARLASFALVSQWLPSCVLLVFALLVVCRTQRTLAVQVPRYEFQIEFYDTPALWQKCPDGWRKHSQKCVKLFFAQLSWEDASKVCKSHGGYLVEIWGFNQNIHLGWLLQEALSETYAQQEPNSSNIIIFNAAIASSQRVWIGLKRTGNGRYIWSSGKPGTQKQGFWDKGSPPSFTSNSTNVIEKCCDINLGSTEYGQFRWSLGECDEKKQFVCEVAACNIRQYRCVNGLKCVSGKSICDGIQDCDDGSDEQQCQHALGCGGSMKGENGTFQSPGYPGRYPNHANCVWHIQSPLGTKVLLQFESFDVESKYDFVEVYDSSERQNSALLGRYSGTSVPVITQSASNFLLVIFTSDRSIETSGFNASWSAVQNDGLTGSCGGELEAQQSVQWFTSPLFPSNYPDNLVCDWTITAPGTSDYISLQFHDFELEDIYDWLEVFNNKADSNMLLGRFSGSQLPQVIISSSPKIFVRLKTDSGNSMRGFNASYSIGCSIDIVSGYARFASPGYGVTDYPSSLDCVWRIFDPKQRKLKLVFNPDFNTEINLDIVKVYNTSEALSSSLVTNLSGTLAPSAIRSTAGAFVVTFHSDSSLQKTGWTAAVSYDCEPLQVQPPLGISSQALMYESTVNFSCQQGYLLNGTNFTICDLQAVWKPAILPSCILVDCKAPKVPNNGYVMRLTGTVFGSVATYTCNKGFYLKGANTSGCQQDGWSAIPECQEIYCPKELPPMHGRALAEENTYGAMREYFCESGYRMVGAKFSYCTLEGKWTSPVPECHFLQCPAIAGVVNGSVEPSGPISVGDVVAISCESGYQLVGHSRLTCLDFFNYSQPVPYCIDVDECEMTNRCTGQGLVGCQNLQGIFRCLCQPGYDHPANNVSVCEDVDECATENGGCSHRCRNKAGSYECYCDDGYVLYQGPVIVINGGQLVTNKSCIVPCPGLNVTGGTVVYTGSQLLGGLYLSHAQAVVACPAGTVPDGPTRLRCLDTGIWSANVTSCQKAICFRPDTPDHGQVVLSGQEQGSNALYSCEEGFHLRGPAKRYCQPQVDYQTWEHKLSWTGQIPTCQSVDCGVPPEIPNGVVHYTTTTIGSLAIYLCNCGYELTSQGVRTCQTNGLWSGSNTQCAVQHCSNPGRPLYGSMVPYSDVFPVGMVVHYKCDRPGYQLSDPWPVKCLPQSQLRVSTINPVYRVSVSLNFTTMDDTFVTSLCGPYYQKLVLKHLREFIPRLCMQNNLLIIAVSNSSELFTQESNFSVTGWFDMTRSNEKTPQSVCQCGQVLASDLQTVLSLGNFPFLVPSLELDCSPASLLKETVRSVELGWTCPVGLKLRVPDDPCGQGVIACIEECVSLVPPVTMTTTAVKSTTTAPSSPMTLQTTTAAAQFNTTTPQSTALTSSAAPVTSRGTTAVSSLTTAFTFPRTTASVMTSSAGTTAATTSALTTTSPAPVPPTATLPLTTQRNASSATSPTQTTKAATEVMTTAVISSEATTTSTVALPQLLMEVEDYLAGNFTNITCVDEVHKDINKKVNEVLRDFNNLIGKDACKETPAVSLKLSSGNISFKRQQASIFMQFSMTSSSTNASKTSVENCSQSFVEFVVQSLPDKFSLVSQVVVPKYCTYVMYTLGSMNVTRKIWSCPAGYQLTTFNINICERLTTTVLTTTPTAMPTPSSTAPPVPVSTVPRMIMTFSGTMVKVRSGSRKELESCIPEYVLALTKVLGDLESGVQTIVASSCTNIFIGITSSVSLLVHDANRVQVTADAILFSLSEWISHSALNVCASLVQTSFYQPSVHLSNLTVPDRYLKNCTSLLLDPDQLTAATNPVFSCPDLFVYDAQNFICIAGNTPSLMIQINLTITGLSNNERCRNAVQSSASVLSYSVEEDLVLRLNNKLICSMSDRVVLLPKNSQLLLSNDKGIISLPLTLLSLHGLVASVENCRNQVYSQLSLMLTEPVQSLKASIKQACPAAIEPANFTRDKEIWMCFEGWVYNPQNQTCDPVVAESSAKTKGLMSERKRRDTTEYNQNDKPYWNTTLPICQDQEAPVFTGCPKTNIEVQLGPNGPAPVDIRLPTVSDNSYAVLTISYQPPEFQLPFTFHQNMTVNITATDPAGNQAVCRISVVLVDVTPPQVLCPAGLHREHYSNDSSNMVAVVYPPDLVIIADNSGISQIDYNPAPGMPVEVLREFSVVVMAVDFAGNRASCTFSYIAESDRCSLEKLPVPAGGEGQRICTSESAGSVAFGISCQLSCPQNHVFITPPPVQYVCLAGGVWNPNANVPLCGALKSANFNFNMTLNFSYDGSADQNCADAVGNSINSELKSIYVRTCQKWLNSLDVTIDHMGIFQWPFFNLKVRVSIMVVTPEELNSTAKDCGSSILSQVEGGLELMRGIPGCGNTTFQPPADFDWQTTCLPGFAIYEYSGQRYCLECPEGSYFNASHQKCEACPVGYYQDERAQFRCFPCPASTSTLSTGAKTVTDCLEICGAGFWSPSGLSPCWPCSKGEYQPASKETHCLACPNGQSTAYVGCASPSFCRELCQVGYYSSDGLVPCLPCPLHHFTETVGAKYCSECPPEKSTLKTGSSSISDCIVVDWCRQLTCVSGSTCVDWHRFAQCLCPPGFTGDRCQDEIEQCTSSPCVNGGVCVNQGSTYSCQCTPGFTGKNCDIDTDECSSNPCFGGVCIDGSLSFRCLCNDGYTGERCENDIDECKAKPCNNGGHCLDLVAGFACDCTGTGYEGALCERRIDVCSNTPCLNGGTCQDRLNGFICTCAPGFTGDLCEVNTNDCELDQCSHGALCVDGVDSFSCICQPGFTGSLCNSDIDECASAPCLNHGNCTNLVNDYLCTCPDGYNGRNCEQYSSTCLGNACNISGTQTCRESNNSYTCICLPNWRGVLCDVKANPCESSPCADGATCTPLADTFVCSCPPDFTGTLCNHRLDDCLSGPCMNNGTCMDKVHSYDCACSSGFTGSMCEKNIDECASFPCENGSVCKDTINGYICLCASGFEGDTCNINIDDCTSQPCANGGTCKDKVGGYKCNCTEGFTGRTCAEDINECAVSPCQNGATCVNTMGSYYCQCSSQYQGHHCETNDCPLGNICLNNGSCQSDSGGTIVCSCTDLYTGADCGKEKSGDFDLHFYGDEGSASSTSNLSASLALHLAVCLWVRCGAVNTDAMFLSIRRADISSGNSMLLSMSRSTVSVALKGEKEPQRYSLSIATGVWHHVCYQWHGSQHEIFLDGLRIMTEKYGVGVMLPERLILTLGQQSSSNFQGDISLANIFSVPLNESQVLGMAASCSDTQTVGNLFAWPSADVHLVGLVKVVSPSNCGKSECPPGFSGIACDLELDKIAPSVVSCPPDKIVTDSNSAMVIVQWEEPVFEDNVGIASIQQTHRSGQAFRQGEYIVTYVAYDAENNSAECSFEIIIRPSDCIEPLPPANGVANCGSWEHGIYCSAACLPLYSFVEQLPPYYTCGKLGFWDPPRGTPFHFPPCARKLQPNMTLVGIVFVRGPACTTDYKADLKAHFSLIMTNIHTSLGLCKAELCDFEKGLLVTCDNTGLTRSKRETDAVFQVAVNVSISVDSISAVQGNGNWAAEELMTGVKARQFDTSNFTVDPVSSQLSVDFKCGAGQVLRVLEQENFTRICLDCPVGYFYNGTVGDCQPCPEGSYSTQPRQESCAPCPQGTATSAPGATSLSSCLKLCDAGSYYVQSSGRCMLCPRGQYQGVAGQTSCLNCPIGQSTDQPGATVIQLCKNICQKGQEINVSGECSPCPQGSYQEDATLPVCKPCPYGWTTPTMGSISVEDCSVVVCEKGHRLVAGSNTCVLCPVGTYQPTRGSDYCIPCGVQMSTSNSGATSQLLCRSGPVNECLLGIHNCHQNAYCIDTEDKFKCQCKNGYSGDGTNCTDLCENFCDNDGECAYGANGDPVCSCRLGSTGPHCENQNKMPAAMSSAMTGGIAGSVVAFFVIIVFAAICCWRHRTERKMTHNRIYRTQYRAAAAGFYNEGYQTVRERIPSQMIVHEQSSSTSSSSSFTMAPRWNRSTFANSDEDEMDACWFESFPMDDLSLGSDAFTRTNRAAEAEAYF